MLYLTLKHHDKYGHVFPANWEKGKASIEASFEGVVDYLSKFSKKLTHSINKSIY